MESTTPTIRTFHTGMAWAWNAEVGTNRSAAGIVSGDRSEALQAGEQCVERMLKEEQEEAK